MGILGAAAPREGGGSPPAGAHAYWRVRVTKTTGGSGFSVSIGEIVMRGPSSMANLCTGGTPIDSAHFGSYFEPGNAFDGNPNTRWASPVGAPHWVGYHFSSPVEITQVAISAPTQNWQYESPEDFTIDWSDDGTNWTTAHTVTGEPAWSTGTTRIYTFGEAPAIGEHRYWRILIKGNDGGSYAGFSELELKDADGIVRSGGGTTGAVSDSDVNSSNNAIKAFDGNTTSTGWLAANSNANHWIRWDFLATGAYGSPVEVAEFDIYGSWNSPGSSPSVFELQYSDDASTWTTVGSYHGETGWSASEKRTFTVP